MVNFHEVKNDTPQEKFMSLEMQKGTLLQKWKGWQKNEDPAEIPIYYVFHTKSFDRVKIMHRSDGKKVHVVTVFGQ